MFLNISLQCKQYKWKSSNSFMFVSVTQTVFQRAKLWTVACPFYPVLSTEKITFNSIRFLGQAVNVLQLLLCLYCYYLLPPVCCYKAFSFWWTCLLLTVYFLHQKCSGFYISNDYILWKNIIIFTQFSHLGLLNEKACYIHQG